MAIKGLTFVPLANSEAGLCLTGDDWHIANTKHLSFSLETLLFKPGYEQLKEGSDFRSYFSWSGELTLNAASLKINAADECTLQSPYDGLKLKLSIAELHALIIHIAPDRIILPKGWPQYGTSALWPDTMLPYYFVADFSENSGVKQGVYFKLQSDATPEEFKSKLEYWGTTPKFVLADTRLHFSGPFNEIPELLYTSDVVLNDAIHGQVFCEEGVLDLQSSDFAFDFRSISANCVCSTCSMGLTRAYLHHLLANTPLLCQRFLLHHQLFWLYS